MIIQSYSSCAVARARKTALVHTKSQIIGQVLAAKEVCSNTETVEPFMPNPIRENMDEYSVFS